MANLFISYARADIEKVTLLINALMQETGWSVWSDAQLVAGDNFRQTLQARIEQADCVVVVWSKAAVLSDYVLDEAELARTRGVLVPVSLDGTKPPLGFGSKHTRQLTVWDRQPLPWLSDLIGDIQQVLARDHKSDPPVVEPARPRVAGPRPRRLLVFAGLLIAAVVAAILGMHEHQSVSSKTTTPNGNAGRGASGRHSEEASFNAGHVLKREAAAGMSARARPETTRREQAVRRPAATNQTRTDAPLTCRDLPSQELVGHCEQDRRDRLRCSDLNDPELARECLQLYDSKIKLWEQQLRQPALTSPQ